ncbi:Alcohol dehydrogenase (NADP(+)) [Ascochyta rabiei]|uniref:Alcohol dehydrogenase (NADP(+)) n=1 Tax=Didymella rabiei TaxID=5454 RepID=UPI001901F7B9|nr:Alcohol dehydrogenase (NADP(+)) [Ascochyta rabiei]UPX11432.1 Alcohol dehydrogenase (NADP(+)) [Ascochyta rabiei]
MSSPAEFHGWLGRDNKAAEGNMTWSSFEPKPFNPIDVDIKISHCGICGSDIHTLRSGWGSTRYPVCVGHEIVGSVVRVGDQVKHLRLGDRVGVGAQAFSCFKCEDCKAGLEQHCGKMVGTYNGKYPDGSFSMGGYANYARVPAHFTIKIPAGLRSEDAAPMMCGGITVYSPLKKNGAGPGKRVGIVGLGGLGHFGVLFAKALGCEKVVAISRRRNKEKDAREMGATDYIATSEDEKWARKHSQSLDLIISTVSSPDMPLESYLRLLRTNGTFIQVGAPEDKLPRFGAYSLIQKGVKIGGSNIGSPKDIEEMLQFAAEKGVKPWVEQRNMKDANKSVVDMEDGKARYRYVLVNMEEENRAKL